MKKVALVLVVLLVVPILLTACGSESQDAAKDYITAVLEGDVEEAQKYACDEFKDQTVVLVETLPGLGENNAVRNIDLKYDLGKGNNQKEVIITGSYDIVTLNASGNVVADSAVAYEVAASVRDKRDIDGDGDENERIDTRILVEMVESDGDWCVALLERGYWAPVFGGEAESAEEAEDAEEVDEAETDDADSSDAEQVDGAEEADDAETSD